MLLMLSHLMLTLPTVQLYTYQLNFITKFTNLSERLTKQPALNRSSLQPLLSRLANCHLWEYVSHQAL